MVWLFQIPLQFIYCATEVKYIFRICQTKIGMSYVLISLDLSSSLFLFGNLMVKGTWRALGDVHAIIKSSLPMVDNAHRGVLYVGFLYFNFDGLTY